VSKCSNPFAGFLSSFQLLLEKAMVFETMECVFDGEKPGFNFCFAMNLHHFAIKRMNPGKA
jgi:hypothetical protein